MTFKIDFDKFVKVKAIESFDDVPDEYSVYCCTRQAPEKIDKVTEAFDYFWTLQELPMMLEEMGND